MNTHRNLFASMALLTALTAPALAQTDAPVKLSLSQMKPSEVFQMIAEPGQPNLLPSGITMVSPDDVNRCLLVQGTAEGVKSLREMVLLLDVPQKTMRLDARILLQNQTAAGGPPKREVVATATIQMTNNRQGEVLLVGQGRVFRIQVTPHVNGDGSVTLFTGFSNIQHSTLKDGSHQSSERQMSTTRRMSSGAAKVVAGFSVEEEASKNAIPDAQNIDNLLLATVPTFLLEVTPTETPAPDAEGKNQTAGAAKRKQPKPAVK